MSMLRIMIGVCLFGSNCSTHWDPAKLWRLSLLCFSTVEKPWMNGVHGYCFTNSNYCSKVP
jgi:hypothetical protein